MSCSNDIDLVKSNASIAEGTIAEVKQVRKGARNESSDWNVDSLTGYCFVQESMVSNLKCKRTMDGRYCLRAILGAVYGLLSSAIVVLNTV